MTFWWYVASVSIGLSVGIGLVFFCVLVAKL